MTRSRFHLYGPFVAVLAAQVVLAVLLPSTGQSAGSVPAAGSAYAGGGGAQVGVPAGGTTPAGGVPGSAMLGASRSASLASPSAVPGGVAGPATGDTRHCTPDGRQFGFGIYQAPPCEPAWTGPNGGATWQGVAARSVKVIVYVPQINQQVSAILKNTAIVGSDPDGAARFRNAAADFVGRHYELYGRRLDLEAFQGACNTTPEDVPCLRQEDQEIIARHPFMVLYTLLAAPSIYDDFTRAGVVVIGGFHPDASFYTNNRPFRWQTLMDGTTTAATIAEYYCKNMQGRMADHSGAVIHPSIGARGHVRRKVGIAYVDDEEHAPMAQYLARLITGGMCGSGDKVVLAGFNNDINTGAQQVATGTSLFINQKVTTTILLFPAVSMPFFTTAFASQQYYPEILIAGEGQADNDTAGQLNPTSEYSHAFGLGQERIAQPLSESDATRVWRATGRTGVPTDSDGSTPYLAAPYDWDIYNLMGSMLQVAGPTLTPATVEQGMFRYNRGGWNQTGGRADVVWWRFGPGKYTAVSDVREIYWDAGATSPINGKPGAWVSLDGGHRYAPGDIPAAGLPFPAAAN